MPADRKYSSADSLPFNARNPYDSFGHWHNLILDSVNSWRRTNTASRHRASYPLIEKLCRGKRNNRSAVFFPNTIPGLVTESAVRLHQFVEQLNWSDSVKCRLHKLFVILRQASVPDPGFPKIKTEIVEFEKSVMESGLPERDKEVLFKAATIGRHSAYKWLLHPGALDAFSLQQLQTLHQGQGISDEKLKRFGDAIIPRRLFEKVGKWFAVTICDMGGAIADLSLESAVAASDYMSEIFQIH
ncbi:hypothetical protein GCM10027051_05440 [Niabella terrae]